MTKESFHCDLCNTDITPGVTFTCVHPLCSRYIRAPDFLKQKRKLTVPELLHVAAATYEERNKLYGDNYKLIGPIMQIMFPEGLRLTSAEDYNRFGAWWMAFNKLVRYGMQLENGGHLDSAHDAVVYAAMLEELTL